MTVWDHTDNTNTKHLGLIYRRVAVFVMHDICAANGVSNMLQEVPLETLKSRLLKQQVTKIFRMVNQLVEVETFDILDPKS